MYLVYVMNEFDNSLVWTQVWNEDRFTFEANRVLQKHELPREEWTKPLDWLRNKYPYKSQ